MSDRSTRLVALEPSDAAARQRWDDYVALHPDATFFHRAGWASVVAGAFGHPVHYAMAERGGKVVGVLPLVHVKSRLFSNGLISNAFCVYGGPLADDEPARGTLVEHALAKMDAVGADFVEFRGRKPDATAGWTCRDDLYVTFRRPIEADEDRNLKAIPRKQRAVVRKASKQGALRDVIDPDVERLYGVYAESVRNLGTPVFSRRWLQLLKREFGEDCEVLTVEGPGGVPVTSVLSFYFRDEVLPYYGGGTDAARQYGANDFMYWRVLCRAAERGVRLFDFGRSKRGTGSFSFKKHWGFEPEPLYYSFHVRGSLPVPEINPLNPKYRLFIAAWKRLPLPVANVIGPMLSRSLG